MAYISKDYIKLLNDIMKEKECDAAKAREIYQSRIRTVTFLLKGNQNNARFEYYDERDIDDIVNEVYDNLTGRENAVFLSFDNHMIRVEDVSYILVN